MEKLFDTVSIVGPGLIGGSIGLALRRRELARHVIGIGRRQSSLDIAVDVGAIDETSLDPAAGVQEADLVILATPISTIIRLAPTIIDAMPADSILTEVASTKQSVIKAINQTQPSDKGISFVPTHPMAGSEKRGAGNADEHLFESSVCIICPTSKSVSREWQRITQMWEKLGARVSYMKPAEHDRLVARISHLPHIAAAALMQTVTPQQGEFAGGGLIDTTRIASGDPGLWRDICATNVDAIAEGIDTLIDELRQMNEFLTQGQLQKLEQRFDASKQKRDKMLRLRRDKKDNPNTQ
ncbi:MAG: prephenate dehydrogenase [Candidatus Brocadiia bacterium]